MQITLDNVTESALEHQRETIKFYDGSNIMATVTAVAESGYKDHQASDLQDSLAVTAEFVNPLPVKLTGGVFKFSSPESTVETILDR